ncbi:Uncharacterised protein [Mesomycoplasma hyorhinis]|nr:Uncharacterised protein [Mesomycoplasma hyorhinis]
MSIQAHLEPITVPGLFKKNNDEVIVAKIEIPTTQTRFLPPPVKKCFVEPVCFDLFCNHQNSKPIPKIATR